MGKVNELIDVYDENKNKTGKIINREDIMQLKKMNIHYLFTAG